MRYVIGICFVTALIIWDGVYNEGRYMDQSLRAVKSVASSIVRMV